MVNRAWGDKRFSLPIELYCAVKLMMSPALALINRVEYPVQVVLEGPLRYRVRFMGLFVLTGVPFFVYTRRIEILSNALFVKLPA